MQRFIFSTSLTWISRICVLRDRITGRIGRELAQSSVDASVARQSIRSGANVLDAVFVAPRNGQPKAAVLICHGIGEIVEHWTPTQRLLAANGAASLVFDYSGYGRSTGKVDHAQCEEDAIAAFHHLQTLVPGLPVSILGFSLGSGVATAMITRVPAHRLVLCAAFTSFREAACSLGVPRRLLGTLPPIWHAGEALRDCAVPVLIVHGDKDRLFPVKMAKELATVCHCDSKLLIVPDLGHNQPFYEPHIGYWGPVLAHLMVQEEALSGQEI